jgi:uncharacterized membrane protein YdbT with pleckstrin-like domain
MKNETLAEYIQTSISNGVSREEIAVELLGKGWGEDAIAHAFSTTQVETRAEPHEAPAPTKVVDENEYPISTLWIFKAPIIIVVVEIILLLFGFWAPDLLLILLAALIANPLIRRNFHYQIRSTSFWVQQGVFSKKERDLPYGVIQNVLVKQDIFDRVFGLATLLVENAGNSGGKQNMQANPFF